MCLTYAFSLLIYHVLFHVPMVVLKFSVKGEIIGDVQTITNAHHPLGNT